MADDAEVDPAPAPLLLGVLIYCGLCTAVISSLGVLMVPTIAEAQEVSLPTAQWILTVALLVGAVATPVLGRLADGLHPRRVLLAALLLVAAGSVLAATATTFAQLLLGRALQGVTYGIIPVTMALARTYLPADRVRSGIAALSVTAVTGIGLGYPITGAIAEYLDYRVAFWLAAAFAGSALAIVPFVVPGSRRAPGRAEPFDLIGTALFAGGLGSGLLALAQSTQWGWGSPRILLLFGVAAALLACWARWELRAPAPLIRLDLFRHPDVRLAQLTALGFGTALFAAFAASSQLAQLPAASGIGPGLDAFAAGFVILPLAVGSQLANRVAQPLERRFGSHVVLPMGACAVIAANTALIDYHHHTWQLMVAMGLMGLGFGMALSTMPGLLIGAVPPTEVGSAVGVNAVLRTVGGSIGSAATSALVAAHTLAGQPTERGYQLLFGTSAVMGVVLTAWLVLAAVRVHVAGRPS